MPERVSDQDPEGPSPTSLIPSLPPSVGFNHFDATWYLERYPELAAEHVDPFTHFTVFGLKERRAPNPYFDPAWYLDLYPDVAEDGCDPLQHYAHFGIHEDRQPNRYFDPVWYRASYPDVETSELDPLSHFIRVGVPEGRWAGKEVHGRGSEGEAAPATHLVEPWNLQTIVSRPPGDLQAPIWWPRITFGKEGQATILVVDPFVPRPDHDSGSVRMFQILSLLRQQGWTVAFGCIEVWDEPRYCRNVRDLGVLVLDGHERIEGFVRQLDQPLSTAWVSRPDFAGRYIPLLRCFSPGTRIVYDTVDVHWKRMERHARFTERNSSDEVLAMRELERTLSGWADLTIAITENDRDIIASEAPTASIAVLPNIHEVIPQVEGFDRRCDLIFLGSFDHQPNGDAVNYFLAEIWPLVHQQLPGVCFHILGSNLEEFLDITSTESIDPVGWVEDLGPWLSRSRVMVAPLRAGAGMKGKIGSSISHGLPVVTTSIGAEGMGLVNRRTALIEDDPEEFARSVVELYEDRSLWETLSREGKTYLEEHFSPTLMGPRLDEILRET